MRFLVLASLLTGVVSAQTSQNPSRWRQFQQVVQTGLGSVMGGYTAPANPQYPQYGQAAQPQYPQMPAQQQLPSTQWDLGGRNPGNYGYVPGDPQTGQPGYYLPGADQPLPPRQEGAFCGYDNNQQPRYWRRDTQVPHNPGPPLLCESDEEFQARLQMIQTRSRLAGNGYYSNQNLRGGFTRYAGGAQARPTMTLDPRRLASPPQLPNQDGGPGSN